ncbi:zinc finger CCCH domain-containing protein 14 isoform X1 [Phascolarctos cinereus]|uniref:Zinc finger CCCH domain-containing protein 14 n=1 Tax=Phascolarctos cinereus TaxID=38626 RepID=A0A6P5LDQ2_PHACI|nr:zinc finger CCCH domain-containing protein 14 isoform X1 [Phascolarctos cinereus]XP_020856033.1 zinc finger CCCH domain-containing protein 14 isoform X1 [Phascolarctos cinereus]
MEIGTEISRKIRSAIKGKLQELGAYVDEELPDYIMVMVANKKSQEQMTEDLSLFLGNNTVRFTVWLHGVLDKLRSVTTEPSSLKSSETNIFESSLPSNKTSLSGGDERRHEDTMLPLAVSSTRSEKNDSRVSTSSQDHRTSTIRQPYDDGTAARLMSTVKPLRELAPSEDVIDIKPEPDDLIDEDLNFVQENTLLSRKKPIVTVTYSSSRPSVEIYRPPGSRNTDSNAHLHRLHLQQQNSIQTGKQLDVQTSRSFETVHLCESEAFSGLAETYRPITKANSDKISNEEENFRKRKLPVVSSVVKVKKYNNDGEEEEEDEEYGLRIGSVSSSVSVPAKPERRPSLPPSKQANKNLILKAISEAQESVTKTTNYSTVPQKQTVPVAPRTRTAQEESLIEVVQGQSRLPRLSPPIQLEEAKEQSVERIQGTQQRQLFSRLQIDPVVEETLQMSQDYYDMESMVHADTRSFILKKPKLSEELVATPNQESGMKTADTLRVLSGRLIQTRDLVQPDKPASPKFIVTLDGVPSPPGYMSDQEEEDLSFEGMKPINQTASTIKGLKGLRPQQSQLMSRQLDDPDGSLSNVEMSELSITQKPEKLPERCKYWPACKNGDECAYHHPTSSCKAFPNCKFAEKCLFIHPNCKYDAKCTKPDCPYTHASRRIPVLPPKPAPAPTSSSSQLCRYFPACKKMECPFYHPKHCRFNTQCTRPDCTFYHPAITVPPRHALKWTRPQTRNCHIHPSLQQPPP